MSFFRTREWNWLLELDIEPEPVVESTVDTVDDEWVGIYTCMLPTEEE